MVFFKKSLLFTCLALKGFGCLMGIMANRAYNAGVVLIRIYTLDFSPFAGGIGKTGMAPETDLTALVYVKFYRCPGVIHGRAMTVFTLDDLVWRGGDLFPLLFVAGCAVSLPFVFCFKSLPLLYISRTVPTVCISSLVNAEILGYKKNPCDQDYSQNRQNHI
jgi:hypothetical protein